MSEVKVGDSINKEAMSNDSYGTPDWIKQMFEGWFDPCAISSGELREFDGLGDWKDKTFVNPPPIQNL